MTDGNLPPGWVPEEKFKEHLKLFPMPCLDFLIDVEGQGIAWVRRTIPPMKGQLACFGARVLRTDQNWEQAMKRIAFEETGLSINPEECEFVDQQIVQFDEEADGTGRLDLATCWAVKVKDVSKIKPNPKHYESEVAVSFEIPEDAGEMYRKYAKKYSKV